MDYRSSHLEKGDDYHAIFTDEPHTAMLWELERGVLRTTIEKYFPLEAPRLLDFACGTGRVIEFLSPMCASSVGVDVSESMVGSARSRGIASHFVIADITRDPVLQGQEFDLVTAFRFFPNAEPALRLEAMRALRKLLSPRGVIVFNNHLPYNSAHNWLLRKSGRDPGHTMSEQEIRDLARSAGLRILSRTGLGSLPIVNARIAAAPKSVRLVERVACRFPFLSKHGSDQIYVLASAK